MTDKIQITIDGEEHSVTPGQQLIQALWEAGVDTPNFCYHEDLSIAGNCRICLAEVEGPRGWGLMISCHMPIRPGMNVRTQRSSEKVVNARKGVMEFQLVNHPLDCPICDKAGECKLQEHYMSDGRGESRMRDDIGKQYAGGPDHQSCDRKGQTRGGKHIDLGDRVLLDQERCISCSRCVRFMREVAGDEQLELASRGDHTYITTFPGEKLDHEYDLCTTDVCPVGALTGKHFRFQQRVWFLKKTNSIVPDDSLGANITIDYNEGQREGAPEYGVYRLMPRRNPDVNKSWLHNDSRMLYTQLTENRLTEGLKHGEPCSLAEANTAMSAALASAKKIAIVASGHATNEDNAAVLALLEKLGDRAELFGGSWLAVGEGDGIARSGDPVANRRGCELLAIPDNLDQLCERVAEFDCLLTVGHDLWAADAEKAVALEGISERLVFSAWKDATASRATVAMGVRAWAEVRGTMVNCNDRIQMLQACPICPNDELMSIWEAVSELSGVEWDSAAAWKAVKARVPQLADVSYRSIGALGQQLVSEAAVAASAESAEV